MFKYFYFNLIVYKLGHEKEPKMYSIWHEILKKIASVGELTTLPQTS